MPTAWAAVPLSAHLSGSEELPPVWPDPRGEVRGLAVAPLHEAVPSLVREDPWMYEMLALVDGLRVGDARVRGLATDLLHERLRAVTSVSIALLEQAAGTLDDLVDQVVLVGGATIRLREDNGSEVRDGSVDRPLP